jgi:hypothetical protein
LFHPGEQAEGVKDMQATTNITTQSKVQEDRFSYLMMFCALVMVRKSRASLAETMEILPLSQRVSNLAGELASSSPSAIPAAFPDDGESVSRN